MSWTLRFFQIKIIIQFIFPPDNDQLCGVLHVHAGLRELPAVQVHWAVLSAPVAAEGAAKAGGGK